MNISPELKDRKWVALFSQTGSEIANISKKLKRKPDVIITNNNSPDQWHKDLNVSSIKVINNAKAKTLNILHEVASREDIITLHGWLRIVPPDKCDYYEIYNGHPGLIHLYPELKGKDPQQRFFEYRQLYLYYGSVVHRVTEGVDEGEIVTTSQRNNNMDWGDDYMYKFKLTSREAWLDFFQNYHTITTC